VSDADGPFLRAISSVQSDGAQHIKAAKGGGNGGDGGHGDGRRGHEQRKMFFLATIRTTRPARMARPVLGWQTGRSKTRACRRGARCRVGVGACLPKERGCDWGGGGGYSLLGGGKAANWLCAWVGRSAVGTGF
jgi:hypothetical protein